MSNFGELIEPASMDYGSVIPAYQDAFAEWPWNEISKCEGDLCAGGFSSLTVGSFCADCGECTVRPAYEADELTERFSQLAETRPTLWYVEREEGAVAMAALCWVADAARLAEEKYSDVPAMKTWLTSKFGSTPFVYLDEIFRDKSVRPSGNLSNIQPMLDGFGSKLGGNIVAFRSLQPALIEKVRKTYGEETIETPPDWRKRDFATIRLGGSI